MDDEKYRYIEEKIYVLKRKKKEKSKTFNEIFDERTLMAFYKLLSNKTIDYLDFPISTGKEGNVFRAKKGERHLAVKVYRIDTSSFKNLRQYIEGDYRFEKIKNKKDDVYLIWAQKEYANLKRMYENGVDVPKPVRCWKHILVMDYIGNENRASPILKNAEIGDRKKMFMDIYTNIKNMYHNAKLVHSDLSEFNILVKDNKPYIIDVAQAVPLNHPEAERFFLRDIKNICDYFKDLDIDYKEIAKKLQAG